MKVTVALLDKQANNSAEKLLEVLKVFGDKQFSYFGLVSPQNGLVEKSLDLLSRQSRNSSTSVGYAYSKPAANDYELLQLGDASLVFQGKVYSTVPRTAALQQIAKSPQHCETLLQTLVEETDGDYAF